MVVVKVKGKRCDLGFSFSQSQIFEFTKMNDRMIVACVCVCLRILIPNYKCLPDGWLYYYFSGVLTCIHSFAKFLDQVNMCGFSA